MQRNKTWRSKAPCDKPGTSKTEGEHWVGEEFVLKRKTEIKENLKLGNSKWLLRNGILPGSVYVHSLPNFKSPAYLLMRLKWEQCSAMGRVWPRAKLPLCGCFLKKCRRPPRSMASKERGNASKQRLYPGPLAHAAEVKVQQLKMTPPCGYRDEGSLLNY